MVDVASGIIKKIEEGFEGNGFTQKVEKFLRKELENKNLSQLDTEVKEALFMPGGIADKIAQDVRNINKTQLRKQFNQLKNVKHKVKSLHKGKGLSEEVRLGLARFAYLLAYTVNRKVQGKPLFDKSLYSLISFLVNKVREGTREDFELFENFVEAIIAFHTYYHGD